MVEKGPSNGEVFEASKASGLKPIEQLKKLSESELLSYIRGPILNAENQDFSEERNTGLHKQACLTGGPNQDITRIRDASGRPVYKDFSENVRAPETMEAQVEIANYRNKIEQNPAKFFSEITDLTHNLTLLTVLDPKAELKHEERIYSYDECVRELAKSLNLRLIDLLLLSAIKYTQRLTSGKNPHAEEDLIKKTIDNESIPIPTINNLDRAYRVIVAIYKMVEPRLEDLAKVKGWELSAPLGEANHIFQ